MRQSSPADRDRAQRRVRSITVGSAAGAGVLTLVGAAVTAGTFAGRTVSAAQSTQTAQAPAPTVDPSTSLQPPIQPPGDASVGPPIVSGGS
jgi:hypothetical protein